MQAVILAGGQGVRLQPFTLDSPKPLFPINGRPFLGYLIDQAASFGVDDVLLLLGYKAGQVMDFLRSEPRGDVAVRCLVTPPEFDTGARLRSAATTIDSDFLLMYCDNYCPIDFQSHFRAFQAHSGAIRLMAYANRDGYTRNNLRVEEGQAIVYDKARQTEGLNAVDIGYALVPREALDWLPDGNVNFERVAYPRALGEGRLFASLTEHRYYSIGSYARMAATERFFSHRRAVFLDRDGTLNERPPKAQYVMGPEGFKWLPGAMEAVRLLNEAGCLVLLISNQPGIARGKLAWPALDAVNRRMEKDLAEAGAHLDGIYVCPHGWDEGCLCRKPQPGMLYKAQRDYDLDIPDDCFLFGDDERDLEAARRANCPAALVSDSYPLLEAVKDYLQGKKPASAPDQR